MYKIIGADQKTYGPVSADAIRDWIANRRATGATRAQAEGTSDWKPLSEFPEFKDALANAPAAAPPQMQRTTAPLRSRAHPPTSGMAIASLVCGIFGCLGITAIAGAVLGAVALIRINRSDGRLGGQGVAIAGLCVSGFMLLFLPITAGLMLPALAKAKARAQSINCMNQMKQIAVAASLYNARQGSLPKADAWCEALRPHVAPTVFHCPAAHSPLCTYGFNAALSGRALGDMNPETVLFYEIPGGWNVAGGPEQMIQQPRHERFNIIFADGSARQVAKAELFNLRWKP